MFLYKLLDFFGGSRASLPRASRRNTWRRGFCPEICVKSQKNEAFLGQSGLTVLELSPLLCFPLFGARLGHFYRKNEALKCCCPSRRNEALFSEKQGSKTNDFQSGFAVARLFGGRSFAGNTTFVFCYVGLLTFSRFVSRHILGQGKFAEILFFLWCFVFRHLALFFGWSWVAFGVVLGCLSVRRVWLGRGAPFFGSPLLRRKWPLRFC